MTTTTFKHWRDVPGGAWLWKNFSPIVSRVVV